MGETVVESYQTYLDEQLKSLQDHLDKILESLKANLNLEVNAYMQKQIDYAMTRLNTEKKNHVETFRHAMNHAKALSIAHPVMKSTSEIMEKFAKRQFERSIEHSFKVWGAFIADCKKQMK